MGGGLALLSAPRATAMRSAHQISRCMVRTEGAKQAAFPVQCSICQAWIWNRQAKRSYDDHWTWEHRSTRLCANAAGTAPPPPQPGSEWLHDVGCWSSAVEGELRRLGEEFRQVGLCTWCGDALGTKTSADGLHAHCAFSTAEAALIRLRRLRSLHTLLHAEAG